MHCRRQADLCFNCDEKFAPTQRCAKPWLMMLLDEEDDDTSDDVKVLLKAITCQIGSQTMRVWASVGHSKLIILIDSGSTHNFISTKAADALHLPGLPISPSNIKITDGAPLQCKGKHEDVLLKIEGTKFPVTLFVVPLAGLDIILGIQWLETLGTQRN
ncbi:unnamed protein product [Linum trigynum]|uniref:Uncharacterized protein n=1 Tax=Linum trigynum TaxID=586398 RepID=A0AAV2DZ43_9ROSI